MSSFDTLDNLDVSYEIVQAWGPDQDHKTIPIVRVNVWKDYCYVRFVPAGGDTDNEFGRVEYAWITPDREQQGVYSKLEEVVLCADRPGWGCIYVGGGTEYHFATIFEALAHAIFYLV